MSRSATFAEKARIQAESPEVTDKPESWVMSDNVMMHLFAQVRHIQARMTARSMMSEVSAMVGKRSVVLNFQMALGCAVMIEWCYLRSESAMSGSPEKEWYETLGAYWDDQYEVCKKFYNAPIAVLMSEMGKNVPPERNDQ